MKATVRIGFVNFFPGFDEEMCRTHVLMELCEEYDFVFDDKPQILLVGCYGQQPLATSDTLKVGYYTENLAPDLDNFDYFFGCEYSEFIDSPKYCKRVFGPLQNDIFAGSSDPELLLRSKTRFCNFVYSAPVPHRERFFKKLSRYQPVSAPGKSMNNCSDLSARSSNNWQQEKLDYLRTFKFTIAFENSRRIGYATEKLFDAFRADTIPVYWGDPGLASIVNPNAVVQVNGDWEKEVLPWLSLPEKRVPFTPYFREPFLINKLCGRTNDLINWLRARVPYSKGFAAAIDEIVALDRDDEAYKEKLSQPRLNGGVLKIRAEYFEFWRKIIRQALQARSNSAAIGQTNISRASAKSL